MEEWLIQLSEHHAIWVYLFTAVFASIQGPTLALIFGVLLKLGYFSIIPVYVSLMVGELIGDTIWYMIGKNLGHPFVRKYGKFFSISEDRIKQVEHIFHRYTKSILIISKLTTGFGFAIVTLFTAGLVKIPFKQYITLNLLGQFFWTAFCLGFAYFFSNLYLAFDDILGRMFVIALVIILIGAFFGFSGYVKSRLTKE
jgi:membrane-associated protein